MKRKMIHNILGALAFASTLLPVWSGAALMAQDSAQVPAPDSAPAAPAVAAIDSTPSDSALKAQAALAATGRALYSGDMAFAHGGPSCITCHNVKDSQLPGGGLLAKDLTHVHSRLGEAGVGAVLSSTPFPAMASAYRSTPLTPAEVGALAAYFKEIEQTTTLKADPTPDHSILLLGGGLGIIVWFGLIAGIYAVRKKQSVKHDIYKRQSH